MNTAEAPAHPCLLPKYEQPRYLSVNRGIDRRNAAYIHKRVYSSIKNMIM